MSGLLGALSVAGDMPTQPLRDGALCDLSGFVFKSPEPKNSEYCARITSTRFHPAVGDHVMMNGAHMIVSSVIVHENAFTLRPAFVPRNRIIFDKLIAPILTPPEPKDWSAKRRFKAAKKSSKPPALFASMLNRI